jgi:transposase
MRPLGSPEKLEHRRLRAIALLKKDYQPVDVAHMVGVDRRSVRRWKAAHLAGGDEAIKAKPAGRPQKLGNKAQKELERKLLKGAKAAGFPTDLWTCPRIAQLILTYFGIRYHVDHIGRLLRSLGWSPQKPQRRAIERDEKEIQRWIKQEWPHIKKKLHT